VFVVLLFFGVGVTLAFLLISVVGVSLFLVTLVG
jgi:hypothetical protein